MPQPTQQNYGGNSDLAELAALMQMLDGGKQDNTQWHYLAQMMQQQENAQRNALGQAQLDETRRQHDQMMQQRGQALNFEMLQHLMAAGQLDSPLGQQMLARTLPEEAAAMQAQHQQQVQNQLNAQLQGLYANSPKDLHKMLPMLETTYAGNPTMRQAWERAPWEELNQGLKGAAVTDKPSWETFADPVILQQLNEERSKQDAVKQVALQAEQAKKLEQEKKASTMQAQYELYKMRQPNQFQFGL